MGSLMNIWALRWILGVSGEYLGSPIKWSKKLEALLWIFEASGEIWLRLRWNILSYWIKRMWNLLVGERGVDGLRWYWIKNIWIWPNKYLDILLLLFKNYLFTIRYRGYKIPEENVALPRHGATVLVGEVRFFSIL